MEKIRIYKRRAKASLKNNWGNAVVVLLIITAVVWSSFVLSLLFKDSPIVEISFQMLVNLLLVSPICWGMYIIFLSVMRGEDIKIGHILCAYHKGNFGRVLSTIVIYTLLAICISIVAMIPPVAILLLSGVELTSFSSLIIIYAFIIIALTIASVYWSMTYFIMWDDARMRNMRAIKASAHLMKGHFWRYVGLCLSFIGWIILGIISLGVGFLWIVPYINTAMAHFYEDLKAEHLPQM